MINCRTTNRFSVIAPRLVYEAGGAEKAGPDKAKVAPEADKKAADAKSPEARIGDVRNGINDLATAAASLKRTASEAGNKAKPGSMERLGRDVIAQEAGKILAEAAKLKGTISESKDVDQALLAAHAEQAFRDLNDRLKAADAQSTLADMNS